MSAGDVTAAQGLCAAIMGALTLAESCKMTMQAMTQ